MNKKLLYKRTIECLGEESQVQKAIEECAELIVALEHWKTKRANAASVITEIADVRIMAAQLSMIFGAKAVREECESKRARLLDRLLADGYITEDEFQEIVSRVEI